MAGEELGGGQREVEAAEEEVRHGEVDDEDGRGVAHLPHAPVICHFLDILDHFGAQIKAFFDWCEAVPQEGFTSKV